MTFVKPVLAAGLFALAAAPVLAETPADVLVVAQNIDDIVEHRPGRGLRVLLRRIVTKTYDPLVQYERDRHQDARRRPRRPNGTSTMPPRPSPSPCATASSSPRAIRCAPRTWSYSFKRVVTLNKAPAFILTQLGWTPENIEQMVTGRRQ